MSSRLDKLKIPKHPLIKKELKYLKWSLIGVATTVGIVGGSYIVGVLNFEQAHFNNHVKVNNVDISRLSINQAYSKVKKQGTTSYKLIDGKLTPLSNGNSTLVSKKQLKTLFKAQYTIWTSHRQYTYLSDSLRIEKGDLDRFNKQFITLKLGSLSQKVTTRQALDNITYSGGEYSYDDTNLNKLVEKLTKKNQSYQKQYSFTAPDGNKLTVKNDYYGWTINTDNLVADIEDGFDQGKKTVNVKNEMLGSGFNTKTGEPITANQGLGNDYLVFAAKTNKLWIVENNKVVATIDQPTYQSEIPSNSGVGVVFTFNISDYTWGYGDQKQGQFNLDDEQKAQFQGRTADKYEPIIIYNG